MSCFEVLNTRSLTLSGCKGKMGSEAGGGGSAVFLKDVSRAEPFSKNVKFLGT